VLRLFYWFEAEAISVGAHALTHRITRVRLQSHLLFSLPIILRSWLYRVC
jgi:hypothetical protein